MDFINWTEKERQNMFQSRNGIKLTMDSKYLGFQNLENDKKFNVFSNFELPPPFLDDENYLKTMVGLSLTDNIYNKWLRTLLRVYREGGKILFCKINSSTYEITIEFSK